ncbi:MAG: RrF2 family transcriptional regulator [Candidatus Kryptoniota bacterium]
MSLIFSRQCEYALQAILYISTQPKTKFTNINEISDKLEIPRPFLGKTLQLLVKNKILSSQKGPKGGFKLAKNSKDITLFHVIDAIDGAGFLTSCILGFPHCSGKNPCPIHAEWGKLRDKAYLMLASKTILDISKEIGNTKQFRMKFKLT